MHSDFTKRSESQPMAFTHSCLLTHGSVPFPPTFPLIQTMVALLVIPTLKSRNCFQACQEDWLLVIRKYTRNACSFSAPPRRPVAYNSDQVHWSKRCTSRSNWKWQRVWEIEPRRTGRTSGSASFASVSWLVASFQQSFHLVCPGAVASRHLVSPVINKHLWVIFCTFSFIIARHNKLNFILIQILQMNVSFSIIAPY